MVGYDIERRKVVSSLEGVSPALVSISGVAGSGKTTLAAAAVEILADRGWWVAWVDVAVAPAVNLKFPERVVQRAFAL